MTDFDGDKGFGAAMLRMQSIGLWVKVLLGVALCLTAILSIGSLFWHNFPLELFTSFRVYYLLLAAGIAIVCVICQISGLRTRLLLCLALGLLALNSAWIIPWYLPHAQQRAGETMRALTFNINAKNDRWDDIANAIREAQPDIAAIQESSPESKEQLSQRLMDLLPFSYRTSDRNLTLLSRFPLISPQSKNFDHGTALITSLQINGNEVQIIAIHATVPMRSEWFQQRNAFLSELTDYLIQEPQRSRILLGDFNLTPWSSYYSQLIRTTGLHNTRFGFGIEPSWVEAASYIRYPVWLTSLVKIPIDQILVSPNIRVSDCQTRRAGNADHRMLWSDLIF